MVPDACKRCLLTGKIWYGAFLKRGFKGPSSLAVHGSLRSNADDAVRRRVVHMQNGRGGYPRLPAHVGAPAGI